jgi:hypothetical protein
MDYWSPRRSLSSSTLVLSVSFFCFSTNLRVLTYVRRSLGQEYKPRAKSTETEPHASPKRARSFFTRCVTPPHFGHMLLTTVGKFTAAL